MAFDMGDFWVGKRRRVSAIDLTTSQLGISDIINLSIYQLLTPIPPSHFFGVHKLNILCR
jgi:hypothetical protein